MRQRFKVSPAKASTKPYDTDARCCIYSEAFNSYLYTPTWVEKIVREIGTPETYRAFFGKEPRMKKVISLPKQAGSPTEEGKPSLAEQKRLSRGASASRQRSGRSERLVRLPAHEGPPVASPA
ncbi:hypothetical protein OR263_03780 [Streptomyces sp. NEAU-H22]|uniref:hypothetical protein n=1 Tax=unclassified Streptomyces TaxID=2593676 RepID=UPI00225A160C|nr:MULTISPECIES: hypothetical protein [unclassified Streptomyces]MCX3285853.1 hypothetical protein [Streptomyces sp. NEAU-H22]WMD03373.1 hypothetical protein Q7C01_02810 [Streptomyces sp. FXY-T5]